MPKTNQILQIEPPEALVFTGPFTEVVKSTLSLTNPSDYKVAFKIKTTAPKRYCVRPNSGTLAKGETMSISVMLQPFEFDPNEKTKHKFMIQSLIIASNMEEKDLWQEVDKEKLMDTKLRVVFENEVPAAVEEVPKEVDVPNNLDISTDPVTITPHKSNFKEDPQVPPSGDNNFQRLMEENKALSSEVNRYKEELQQLKRVAMSETKTTAATATTLQAAPGPTGISLLFHETTNIILILGLLVASFGIGLMLSSRLGA
ncbi:vesicle-associated membrane protein-associated protein B-like isoform X2 [Watersipora subatra]|uniref:vesicle-associated membrane protein-associated protein B-like isoform X2 n=1 Tax=Watersipora subatra TaxID=2589382 RepID=UPI00355AD107